MKSRLILTLSLSFVACGGDDSATETNGGNGADGQRDSSGDPDADAVAAALQSLTIQYAPGDSANSVTADLGLPNASAEQTTIAWSSSNSNYMEVEGSTGQVTAPAISVGHVAVTPDGTAIASSTATPAETSGIRWTKPSPKPCRATSPRSAASPA